MARKRHRDDGGGNDQATPASPTWKPAPGGTARRERLLQLQRERADQALGGNGGGGATISSTAAGGGGRNDAGGGGAEDARIVRDQQQQDDDEGNDFDTRKAVSEF